MSEEPEGAPCLHCELMDTIEDYFRDKGEKSPSGKFVLDIAEALEEVAVCVAELLDSVDEKHRASARKHFFEALAIAMYGDDDEAEATLQ